MNITNYPFEKVESPFNLLVKGDTIYNGKPIFELLEYEPEKRLYAYEDDAFFFYDPTGGSPNAHSFLRLKKLFPISETMHLNTNIADVKNEISYLHFRFFNKNLDVCFDGFIFSNKFLENQKNIKKLENKEVLFTSDYGILIEKITIENLLFLNEILKKINYKILENFLIKRPINKKKESGVPPQEPDDQ